MNSALSSAINTFIEKERLPLTYADTVETWFLPLAESLLRQASVKNQAMVVGISGCQGSGKSTLASLLVLLFKEMMGLNAINLSIDDFYLTYAQRQVLAETLHPLFATRGVPGTHDMQLATDTISALRGATSVAIPRFDKSVDDRFAETHWPLVQGPVDVIILEGWCLNIPSQLSSALASPINELERNEDTETVWRTAVNQSIVESYLPLYDLVEHLIMLKAPNFEKVFEWRQNQEDKLAALTTGKINNRVMSLAELKRFIQHYERLTRHGLEVLPELADTVFQLTDQQTILNKIKG